jgi:hypothetical protein
MRNINCETSVEEEGIMKYLTKGMAGYDLIQPTDLRYNCPPYNMQRMYECVKWELIGFRKENKAGKGIVICVWKAKKMSQEEAMLIAGQAWRKTTRNHSEMCAIGQNWWREAQKKLAEAALIEE